MNTIPAGSPAYYAIREAAWVLGVNPSRICRAIRIGTLPIVRRRNQLVVPAHALARLLGDAGPPHAGGDAR
jgi:hypothetical protein